MHPIATAGVHTVNSAKHTPLIRLSAAKRQLGIAQEACSHWDYESDGCGYECCNELAAAERELRAARAAMER